MHTKTCRFLAVGCFLFLASATEAAAPPAKTEGRGSMTIRSLHYEVTREPDGKRYPNQVKETYRLDSDGTLRYSAYFGGMPTNMNHMDGVEWASGDSGRKLLATALKLLRDPTSGLRELPDDRPYPPDAFLVGVTRENADSTWYVDDRSSKAWAALETAFGALIAEFEKSTGRPKTAGELPQ